MATSGKHDGDGGATLLPSLSSRSRSCARVMRFLVPLRSALCPSVWTPRPLARSQPTAPSTPPSSFSPFLSAFQLPLLDRLALSLVLRPFVALSITRSLTLSYFRLSWPSRLFAPARARSHLCFFVFSDIFLRHSFPPPPRLPLSPADTRVLRPSPPTLSATDTSSHSRPDAVTDGTKDVGVQDDSKRFVRSKKCEIYREITVGKLHARFFKYFWVFLSDFVFICFIRVFDSLLFQQFHQTFDFCVTGYIMRFTVTTVQTF